MNSENRCIISSSDVAKVLDAQAIKPNDEIIANIELALKGFLNGELAYTAYRKWHSAKKRREEGAKLAEQAEAGLVGEAGHKTERA